MLDLPDFPWDSLDPYSTRARAHPGGLLDLSIGSPVDATPAVVRTALAEATDAHAYPQTAGTPALREAIRMQPCPCRVGLDLVPRVVREAQDSHAQCS